MRILLAGLLCVSACRQPEVQPRLVYDVVVYGGTSAGVVAAVRVRRGGRRVLLVEPTAHLGGLSSSGLGATDIGNKGAIGGIGRAFYRSVGKHYGHDEAWTFEPHVAEAVFEELAREAAVDVRRNDRLDRGAAIERRGRRLVAIRLESGRVVAARVFIDASYEGDLLAAAGVPYRVGREANREFGESLNGVQTERARHHQFVKTVDPWRVRGDPSSGLLPHIQPGGPGAEGEADRRVQAYCFRLCATDVAANRVPWPKPKGYDPLDYELLLRNFEAGDLRKPWHAVRMPNGKTDSNNNFAFSTDAIGLSYDYPEADYTTRARIVAAHERYQKGLMWTLANSPRVPAAVRAYFSKWGLAKDEFTDSGHWPRQLYVREARRMRGDYVMTERNCRGTRKAPDPVGLGAYGMDSHHVQRYVTKDGSVRNEGDVQVHGFAPYGISYRALLPPRDSCTNLLVPVCLSATHIAFGSIRMEPVFMVLGHSAGAAACLAIEHDVDLHDVDYRILAQTLQSEGQILRWHGR